MSNSSESGRIGDTEGEFSVCQFFKGDASANPDDAAYEYTRRWVGGKEAVDAFFHYCQSVGAQMGMTQRVIITDGLDYTVMEWTHADGITYPPEHAGQLRPGVRELCLVPDSADGSGGENKLGGVHESVSVEQQETTQAGEGSGRDDAADKG